MRETLAGGGETSASVLLVGDDADGRDRLRRILESHGFEVEAVQPGDSLAQAYAHPPDLIVADVSASSSESLVPLRELRLAAGARAIRVLLVSDCTSDEARSMGADDFLARPIDEGELVARVRTHLGVAHLHYDLRTQHDMLYGVIMQSPVPIFVVRGDELVFEIANERALGVVNRRDLVGLKYADVFPQAKADGLDDLLREVMRAGKPIHGDELLARMDRHQDGRLEDSYWAFTWTPLADAQGVYDRIMVAAVDVTHDVLLRRKLKQSEEDLHRLVHQVDAGLAQTSLTGRFTVVSERFCELVGRTEKVLLRRRIQDITHPDDRAPIDAWFLRLVERGSPRVIEARCVKPDGTIVWLQTSLSRAHDRDGRIIGVNAVCIDFTERKLAQCWVRAADRRFLTLVETSTHVIWTTDVEANMSTEQPGWSRFTGQSRTEYSGHGWMEAIHPEDRVRVAEYIERSRLRGEPFRLEHRVRRRDGEYRICVAHGAAIRDNDGTILEWAGTHTDVTEQRALERQLSLLEEHPMAARRAASARADLVIDRLAELTKGLSRDLRGPLSTIVKAANVLERRADFGKIANPVNRILASAAQIQHVVAQLRDLVRIGLVSHVPLEPPATDLAGASSDPR